MESSVLQPTLSPGHEILSMRAMGSLNHYNLHHGHLLIILWEPENTTVTERIRSRFPKLSVVHYCLQTASRQLFEESKSAAPGIRPGRYIFTELLSKTRAFDQETRQASQVLLEQLQRTTILVSLSLLPPSDVYVPKLIHLLSAGVDLAISSPLMNRADVVFTTSQGIHGVPVAEWVVLALLAFFKKHALTYELQKEHHWPVVKSIFSDRTNLRGKRVGILGYGSIGRQVSRLLSAFGCTILAYTASERPDIESRKDRGYVIPGTGDPSGSLPAAWFGGSGKMSLHHFLAQHLDILILSLPLTSSTESLISTEEFNILSNDTDQGQSKCFVVNISRGKVIDQEALVQALNDDLLAGAALDVAAPEPLPQHEPLWEAKNVIISPHVSTLSVDYYPQALEILVTNLERSIKGLGLLNLVDKQRGY